MKIFTCHDSTKLEQFDIDFSRSHHLALWTDRLRKSDTGQWHLPTKLVSMKTPVALVVSKCEHWPDIIYYNYQIGFVASERMVASFHDVARSQAEVFPVEVRAPRKSPPAPKYFLVNVCGVVDAANLTAMKVRPAEEFPDMKALFLNDDVPVAKRHWILDPDRIPPRAGVFALKYVGGIFFAERLAKRLQSAGLVGVTWETVRLRREDERSRRELLAECRKMCRAFKPPPKRKEVRSLDAAEKLLGVQLARRVKDLYAKEGALSFDGSDIFEVSRLVEETRGLRNWKELEWPRHLVAVSDDGRGGYFALDTSRIKNGDCPVVYFDHELALIDKSTGRITPQLELAARTFSAWVRRQQRGGSALPG